MTVSSRSILVTPSRFDLLAQYTYILSLPTLATFAIGNAVIKYEEGFIFYPGNGSKYHACHGLRTGQLIVFALSVIPKPYQLWKEQYIQAIFPLLMVLSFAWALEM